MKKILVKDCAHCPHVGSTAAHEYLGHEMCCENSDVGDRVNYKDRIVPREPGFLQQWCPLEDAEPKQ